MFSGRHRKKSIARARHHRFRDARGTEGKFLGPPLIQPRAIPIRFKPRVREIIQIVAENEAGIVYGVEFSCEWALLHWCVVLNIRGGVRVREPLRFRVPKEKRDDAPKAGEELAVARMTIEAQ